MKMVSKNQHISRLFLLKRAERKSNSKFLEINPEIRFCLAVEFCIRYTTTVFFYYFNYCRTNLQKL